MSDSVSHNPENWLAHFGLTAFRAGQREVISAVLAGRDCLCIMPTGGGKSLCYQLPAVMRPGVVLVISPLIALMKDQVDALHALGLRATFVNSSLEPFEQRQRLEGMSAGQFDLVYVAPERLRSPRFLESLKSVTVQLLAVDESHCISEWGHDFRPDYARIGIFREKLGSPQTIALTATATPLVRGDVVRQLRLHSPETFITGFARPNLRFEVREPMSMRDKDETLLRILDETPGPGIVYAATRKKCQNILEFLSENRPHPVGLYHAGLLPDERRLVQDAFMSGRVPLIVATNAFGMGIDKRDLRLVVHYNMPGSLEAYYQESGRAGRDGLPSRCVLLFSFSDRYIQEFFIENAYPTRDAVRRVYEFLLARPGDPIELTQLEIKDALSLSLSGEGIGVCERLLEKSGVVERLDAKQNMAQVKLDSDLPTLIDLLPKESRIQRKVLRELEREVDDRRREWVSFHPAKIEAALELDRDALNRAMRELSKLSFFDYVPPFRGRAVHILRRDLRFDQLEIDFDELARRKAAEMEKLDQVIDYAQTRSCRQREILNYFGDSQRFHCGICDNCQPNGLSTPVVQPVDIHLDASLLEAVRIVLSGAARTKGKVGKGLIAKMLCGSQSVKITQLQLDKLSTFGLLEDLNQVDVIELIESLIKAGLLDQSEPFPRRPIVQLTELGGHVMRGQHELPAAIPLSQDMLIRLKSRRRTQARNPTNRLAAHSVTDRSGPTKDVRGMTAPDVSKTQVENDSPLPLSPSPGDEALRFQIDPKPTHYWTWRLFHDGYTLSECQTIRGLDQDVVLDHLSMAARDGLSVQLEWILSAEQQQVLAKVVGNSAPTRLRSLVDSLPPDLGATHVQLFCQVRARQLANKGSA